VGGEPPLYVLRRSDGAFLRLVVVEAKERPHSVFVAESGHFSGDDEASRQLSFVSGSAFDDAAPETDRAVLESFLQPDLARSFFRLPSQPGHERTGVSQEPGQPAGVKE
jgi:hypothetical protein